MLLINLIQTLLSKEDTMWSPTVSSDEIYHHGILRQRWGVRNGPPYPLDQDQKSQAEKRAGWRKSLSDEQKATIKKVAIGTLAVAGIAASAYVISQHPEMLKYAKDGAATIANRFANKPIKEITKSAGNFDKIIPECKKITSDYVKSSTEQRKQMLENLNKVHGEYNCKAGGLAYEAMRRGFDVTAKDIDTTAIEDTVFMKKCYKSFKGYDTIKGTSIENCEKAILNMFKDGQRGNMIVHNPKGTNSHAMAFEIINGKLTLIESRNRIEMTLSGINRRGFSGNGIDLNNIQVVRTDNLEFNDESGFIKRVLKSN